MIASLTNNFAPHPGASLVHDVAHLAETQRCGESCASEASGLNLQLLKLLDCEVGLAERSAGSAVPESEASLRREPAPPHACALTAGLQSSAYLGHHGTREQLLRPQPSLGPALLLTVLQSLQLILDLLRGRGGNTLELPRPRRSGPASRGRLARRSSASQELPEGRHLGQNPDPNRGSSRARPLSSPALAFSRPLQLALALLHSA